VAWLCALSRFPRSSSGRGRRLQGQNRRIADRVLELVVKLGDGLETALQDIYVNRREIAFVP
jgi:hypothetical protein